MLFRSNTIQFFYYNLYFLAIFSAFVLSNLFARLPKYLSLALLFIVLILASINSITTASGYFANNPHAFISNEEREALQFLAKQERGVVLTVPYDKKDRDKVSEPYPLFIYDSTAYISALSKKQTYLSDEGQNEILATDYLDRRVKSKDFFDHPVITNRIFLEKSKVKYIYLQKFYNLSLDSKILNLSKIFDNKEVVIYKVND